MGQEGKRNVQENELNVQKEVKGKKKEEEDGLNMKENLKKEKLTGRVFCFFQTKSIWMGNFLKEK